MLPAGDSTAANLSSWRCAKLTAAAAAEKVQPAGTARPTHEGHCGMTEATLIILCSVLPGR